MLLRAAAPGVAQAYGQLLQSVLQIFTSQSLHAFVTAQQANPVDEVLGMEALARVISVLRGMQGLSAD